MNTCLTIRLILALACLSATPAILRAADAPPAATPEGARAAIDRGISFLDKDTVKWRTERGCATCHHGTMTVWALTEAKQQGFAVNAETLADFTEWTKSRMVPRLIPPRDPRPGWRMASQPGMYLGIMSHNLPVLSREEVGQLALHLARHQEEDGAYEMAPPLNGPPPVFESREVVALLAYLAWEPTVLADPQNAAVVRAGREKLAGWLAKAEPTDSTQGVALRLLVDLRTGQEPSRVQARIDELLKRQSASGGWSQIKDSPDDAYATGQALYVLSFAGLKNDRPEIQRGVSFLVATQREDGSWPMKSRNHPGVESTRDPIRNPMPITYFGAAWGMLGLVRSVSTPPDTPARRQTAFDEIRGFHGKYELDESQPDKPVVLVDLRYYDTEDAQFANIAKALTAFPKLATLKIKSAKMTDAGLAHFKALTQVKELHLEGTKVTDAGVADYEQARPGVKVVR